MPKRRTHANEGLWKAEQRFWQTCQNDRTNSGTENLKKIGGSLNLGLNWGTYDPEADDIPMCHRVSQKVSVKV